MRREKHIGFGHLRRRYVHPYPTPSQHLRLFFGSLPTNADRHRYGQATSNRKSSDQVTYRLNDIKEHLPPSTGRSAVANNIELAEQSPKPAKKVTLWLTKTRIPVWPTQFSVASAAVSYTYIDTTTGINSSRGVVTCDGGIGISIKRWEYKAMMGTNPD